MTYKATGTKNSSGQDVQEPAALPVSANTMATAPAAEAEVARASYVIINVEHATKYEFKYESGGSFVDYGIVAADAPLANCFSAGRLGLFISLGNIKGVNSANSPFTNLPFCGTKL